jgi:transketolase
MRNAFIEELIKLARQDKRIALVVGDLGFSVVESFAAEFPDRFINAGVAEQNMTGLAAGMASEGYHVFTYSIANFPTFRCAEQIRNDIAYHDLPVTIVSVGGGVAYGSLGYSHHAVQDYALMRTFPNMLIAAPGDPMEVRSCVKYLAENRCPSYLRLGKAGEKNIHRSLPEVSPGRWILVRDGNRRRPILSTGATLKIALEWAARPEHSDRAVYSLPLWSMSSKSTQSEALRYCEEVVTLEDHLQDGGFGSWLLEARANSPGLDCKIVTVALNARVCGTVGSQDMLHRFGGLSF